MDNYKIEDLLFEELITLDLEAKDYEEVIHKIGKDAMKKGYVEEGFADAVIHREKLYPTALPTEILKVAIPHPMERDTIKKSAIIVTKLKNPVNFTLMGSDSDQVPVDIVFTLAVDGGEHQLEILQKLVGMFSEPESMKKIDEAKTPADIKNTLKSLLKD